MNPPIGHENLRARFPHASKSFLKANAGPERLRAAKPERPEGVPLERVASGAGKGGEGAVDRTRITLRIFSCRPLDWDNYCIKQIQDCLLHAGLLDSDGWNRLEGHVISEKVHSQAEERAEITIEELP